MQYINRFGVSVTRNQGLKFQYNIGDVFKKDGITQMITGFGIYNDQYWTEKIFEDGCRLSCGDFESVQEAKLIHGNEKQDAIRKYISSLKENALSFPFIQERTSNHIRSFMECVKAFKEKEGD